MLELGRRLGGDAADSGQLADQDPPAVAHQRRVHVFVGLDVAADGVDVHAALVGEGRRADERLVLAEVEVGHLVDEPADLRQVLQRALTETTVAVLEDQVGDDARQVGVAAPLADAVDRALDVAGARLHGRQRVGHAQAAVVVAVDAERHVAQRRSHGLDALSDLFGQSPAVGIAQDQPGGAGLLRGPQRGQGVFGIRLPSVKEVLGVENDFSAGLGQEGDRIPNHGQVLFVAGLQDVADVQVPALAHEGHDVGLTGQKACRLRAPSSVPRLSAR